MRRTVGVYLFNLLFILFDVIEYTLVGNCCGFNVL